MDRAHPTGDVTDVAMPVTAALAPYDAAAQAYARPSGSSTVSVFSTRGGTLPEMLDLSPSGGSTSLFAFAAAGGSIFAAIESANGDFAVYRVHEIGSGLAVEDSVPVDHLATGAFAISADEVWLSPPPITSSACGSREAWRPPSSARVVGSRSCRSCR